MKSVHIHLIINHLVLYSCFFYLLVKIYNFYQKKAMDVKIGLIFQIVLAILLIILGFTGHKAEEQIATYLQDPDGTRMFSHEEWGELAVKIGLLNVIIHLMSLKFPLAKKMTWISLLLLLLLLLITCYYGGQLAHPELR